eukprot:855601-Prymnesium_polylepis.1
MHNYRGSVGVRDMLPPYCRPRTAAPYCRPALPHQTAAPYSHPELTPRTVAVPPPHVADPSCHTCRSRRCCGSIPRASVSETAKWRLSKSSAPHTHARWLMVERSEKFAGISLGSQRLEWTAPTASPPVLEISVSSERDVASVATLLPPGQMPQEPESPSSPGLVGRPTGGPVRGNP